MDTSAWYALEVEDDKHHAEAKRFLRRLASNEYGVSITTDYVLDETLTLLRIRTGLDVASAFVDKLKRSRSVKIFWVGEEMFESAVRTFRDSHGKSWSFTDCTSFALMKELSIPAAYAFDEHFREAGFTLVP